MKITNRLWIGWAWNPKHWHWGRVGACCGCYIYEFGPLGVEYIPKNGECDRPMKEDDVL